MAKLILTFLACFVLVACSGGGDAPTDARPSSPAPAPAEVFLFVGQSNMLGADALVVPANGVQDLVEAGLQTDADRAARFTMGSARLRSEWGDVRGHAGYWLSEPTIGGQTVKVHGPEVGFVRAIGRPVHIIKYADNYLALENGRSAWVSPGSRWNAWQAFIDHQLAALAQPYRIAGIVWFQGIDDGLLQRDKASYKADLRQVLKDLRAKFGAVPAVIIREIDSQLAGSSAMAPIRAAQLEVAAEAGNAWADADGAELATLHHLSSAGQLLVGQRAAASMQRLH